MKKLYLFILFFSITSSLFADIAVKSFRKLDADLDARVTEPIKDPNGDLCAIIKVVTTQTGFSFDGGQLGIVKTLAKASEIWVYVPFGLKRLTIYHPVLGQLRDYIIPIPIEKATVFELVLITGKVMTVVEETIESQWLVITPEPKNALIYINDEFVNSGEYQAKLKNGTYNYRVELPLYHTEAGRLEIANEKKNLAVTLKPAFGYININSEPESNAQVFVDGKLLTKRTPLTTEPIASGEHTVQVIKEMYQPTVQKIKVIDGQTALLNATLQPNFAELTIKAPAAASILLNNQQKGIGSWTGRLSAGIYSIESQLAKHRTARQDIELKIGDNRTVEMLPTPIYGSLDVVTIPLGASISIDGMDYGTTPNTINRLLIGDYTMQLNRAGYEPVSKEIKISEGTNSAFNEIMKKTALNQKEKTTEITEKLKTGNQYVKQIEPILTPLAEPAIMVDTNKISARKRLKTFYQHHLMSVAYAWHTTNFENVTFKEQISNGQLSYDYGQAATVSTTSFPVEVSICFFSSGFRLHNMEPYADNKLIFHRGIELSLNYVPFNIGTIALPYIGVGYQLSHLSLTIGEEANTSTSMPVFKGGLKIKAGKLYLFGEYKKAVSLNGSNTQSNQLSAGIGLTF